MNKRQFYNLGQTARRVRRLLLKKLGVDTAHSGLCGTAAIPLCAELKIKGFPEAIIVNGRIKVDGKPGTVSHYWVEVDGCVVDITANQFNAMFTGQTLPDVVIAPYILLPRYLPDRKDGIKLTGHLHHFLTQWLQTIR